MTALPLVGRACLTMCLLSSLIGLASAEPVLPELPAFGHIPLSFEANQGQAGGSTQFLARGRGYSLSLNRDGVVLALARHRGPRATAEPEAVRPVERILLRMTLDGANPAPLHDPVMKQTGRQCALRSSAPRRPGWR